MAKRNADLYTTIEKHIIRILVLILLLFAAYKLIAVEAPHGEAQPIPQCISTKTQEGYIQKWEYKIVTMKQPSESTFNELGAQGWELIAASYSGAYDAYYVFKRPISN